MKFETRRVFALIWPPLLLGGALIYLLSATWLRWGDLYIDTFREFWVPIKILQGKVLYKDIFYEHGLFSPYFLALIFKVFGAKVNTLVGVGVTLTILMITVLYKLSRLFLNSLISCLVCLVFLFEFAFGHYYYYGIYNFILPYGFAATFFIFFIALALYFFIKFIIFEEGKYLFWWSVAMYLAFLCRLDLSSLIYLAFLATWIVLAIRKCGSISKLSVLYLSTPLFFGILSYFTFILAADCWREFYLSIINHFLIVRGSALNLGITGLNDFNNNTFNIFKSFILQIIVVLSFGLVSSRFARVLKNKKEFRQDLFWGVLLLGLAAVIIGMYLDVYLQYKCLPVILIMGAVAFFVKSIWKSDDYKKNLPLFLLFLAALFLILRIFLVVTPDGYGFYLTILGMLCYYIVCFEVAKDFFQKHYKDFSAPIFSLLLASLSFYLIINSWLYLLGVYKNKNLAFNTERGAYYGWHDYRTIRFWQTVSYLTNQTSRGSTVVVFPEGISINFFSLRENPIPYYNFVPLAMEMIGEDRILAKLRESKVEYIVLTSRITSEYGKSFFGLDYGQKIFSWVKENYEPVAIFGKQPFSPPINDSDIAIWRHKDLAGSGIKK